MSMINCPECGKQISDRAGSCPNCGYPLSNQPSNAANTQATQQKPKNNALLDVLIALSLVIIPIAPVGIILMWVKKFPQKKSIRIIATVIFGVFFLFWALTSCGNGNDNTPKKVEPTVTSNVQTDDKTQENTANTQTETATQEQEPSNIFNVGDVVETEDLRITFLSSSSYVSDNEFLQPKDGYEYWEFEFKFENISDTDQTVSSMMDWECYADNSKVDQSWIGDDNGLDATLSSGRQTQGKIYFEVPKDAKSIELEYKVNFWKSDKIIFVGK